MNSLPIPVTPLPRKTVDVVRMGLTRRRKAEFLFRNCGLFSIVIGLIFLVVLFATIAINGYSAFVHTFVALDVYFDPQVIAPGGTSTLSSSSEIDTDSLLKTSISKLFPKVEDRQKKRVLYGLVSTSASDELRQLVLEQPTIVGTTQRVWLPLDDQIDMFAKGLLKTEGQTNERLHTQLSGFSTLQKEGRVRTQFNTIFFTRGDSREPESAGIWGAVVGSTYTLCVTLILSLPIGMATAVYLEEFSPRNRWTDLIEININNLAAVPSIVFGLLGLALFINFFGLPRSSPLVGGLVLMLMTLPTIIIAGRSALKSVPPSVREAALGIGASPMQTVFDHVLPLAIPGMLTGAIIGMGRALGESAPLLMMGMVAFIVDIPNGITQPATVLPVQIYLWADSPERAFVERTSAAILVLLVFLIAMNGIAVYLRKRYERRW